MNQAFQYQRLVLGYHGCDKSVADRVLMGNDTLRKSEKSYDWLGSGIYFWEHGPQRALEWAEEQKQLGKIKSPAVLGAVIHLGICFDLMDIRYTSALADAFSRFKEEQETSGYSIPRNKGRNITDKDMVRRTLDCSVINWFLKFLENTETGSFDSVRGLFQEDTPVFEGSKIHKKSHIQLAIRNPACILGYFRPS